MGNRVGCLIYIKHYLGVLNYINRFLITDTTLKVSVLIYTFKKVHFFDTNVCKGSKALKNSFNISKVNRFLPTIQIC